MFSLTAVFFLHTYVCVCVLHSEIRVYHLTILCNLNLKYDTGTSIIDFMLNWILTFSGSTAKNQSAKKKGSLS